jgi:hypothetical protein
MALTIGFRSHSWSRFRITTTVLTDFSMPFRVPRHAAELTVGCCTDCQKRPTRKWCLPHSSMDYMHVFRQLWSTMWSRIFICIYGWHCNWKLELSMPTQDRVALCTWLILGVEVAIHHHKEVFISHNRLNIYWNYFLSLVCMHAVCTAAQHQWISAIAPNIGLRALETLSCFQEDKGRHLSWYPSWSHPLFGIVLSSSLRLGLSFKPLVTWFAYQSYIKSCQQKNICLSTSHHHW